MIYISEEINNKRLEITSSYIALPKIERAMCKLTQDGSTSTNGGLLNNGYIEVVFREHKMHLWAPVK